MPKPTLTGKSIRLARSANGQIDSSTIQPDPVAPGEYPAIHDWTGFPLTSDGWTDLTALFQMSGRYEDARVVFVDPDTGSDLTGAFYGKYDAEIGGDDATIPGDPWGSLSQVRPYQTISAALSVLRTGCPDVLMLKRGAVFSGTFMTSSTKKSGRSAEERFIISAYGSGNNPLFRISGAQHLINAGTGLGCNFAIISDLTAYWYELDPENPESLFNPSASEGMGCFYTSGESTSRTNDLLIEGCEARFGEFIRIWSNQEPYRHRNICTRRCSGYGAWRGGIAWYCAKTVRALFDECVMYMNGWWDGYRIGDQYHHNSYLSDFDNVDISVRHTSAIDGINLGIGLRTHGSVHGSLMLKNCSNSCGHSTNWASTYGPWTISYTDNVVMDARDINAGQPSGFGIFATWLQDSVISGNIVANLIGTESSNNIQAFAFNTFGDVNGMARVTFTDNIVYKWNRSDNASNSFSARNTLNWTGVCDFARNKFYGEGSKHTLMAMTNSGGDILFRDNLYGGNNRFLHGTSGTAYDFSGWAALTGETGSFTTLAGMGINEALADKTIEDYLIEQTDMAPSSYSDGVAKFARRAVLVSKQDFDKKFMARTVVDWFRANFGLQGVA